LFQKLVFQKFHISANLSQVHHKHQIYSKHIPNLSKLNIPTENIKLKQKFDLFIIKYFFDTIL